MDDMDVPSEFTVPTWTKQIIMLQHCEQLSISQKREVFQVMRAQTEKGVSQKELHHLYMPHIGMTLGECAIFHMLSEYKRRCKK
jgi:hypothetical protein